MFEIPKVQAKRNITINLNRFGMFIAKEVYNSLNLQQLISMRNFYFLEIIVVGCLLLLIIMVRTWYYRRKHNPLVITQPPFSYQTQRRGWARWWFNRNKFTPELPDVRRYGGGQRLASVVLATEYPEEDEPNPDPFGSQLPYTSRQRLWSTSEQSLFMALEQAISPQPYRILSKVHLASVLQILPNLESLPHHIALERVTRRYLDFVICQTNTSEIVGVVLIEPPISVNTSQQKMSQGFIDSALAAAKIPLIRLPLRDNYPIEILRTLLNHNLLMRLPTIQTMPVSPQSFCPQCGAGLKKATITKGQQAGKSVWACSRYPKCKTVMPVAKALNHLSQ